MRTQAFLFVCLAACASTPSTQTAPATATPTATATAPDVALTDALAKVAAASDGTVAVSVRHLRTGAHASIHGDVALPLMSVFKLPLTIVALDMVDHGELRLDQTVPISDRELRPSHSPIADAWKRGERAPRLEPMLRSVIQDSDNTVGDKLVTFEGGGPAIVARLESLGVHGVHIEEQEIEIAGRLECAGTARPADGWTSDAIGACPKADPDVQRAAVAREIAHAPNAATTDALVDMLAALDTGAILRPTSRAWLHDALAGTHTGAHRLRAQLPEGTRVEHKTGSAGVVAGVDVATNDVGIVTLPNGDRFAIAVLVSGSTRSDDAIEATIAALAKASWDRFVHE
jgi:beta-lactamase class A